MLGPLLSVILFLAFLAIAAGIWRVAAAIKNLHQDYRRVHAKTLERHRLGLSSD